MKFERWWEIGEESGGGAVAADLPLVPDGEHVAKVVKSEFRDLKFKKSDRNEDGTCLCLELEVTGYKRVEVLCDVTWRGKIEAIVRAASQHVPKPEDDWDAQVLVGQYVRIETVQGVGATGREYVKVTRFIAGRDPLPEAIAKAPPRAKAKKGQGGDEDDIPF